MAAIITGTTTMNETITLLRLMSWLSPVFPTGGFAYSAGLEQATADRLVADEADLQDWIASQLTHGSLWNDSVFFAEAHRCAMRIAPIDNLIELALAINISAERLAETCAQGTSFIDAAAPWISPDEMPPRNTPLPICVGHAAGLHRLTLKAALGAYLHTFVTNQLQCAIRLSVIGQTGATRVLAALEAAINSSAENVTKATLDDLGTAAIMADISSMKHETLEPRLFLS